MNRCGSGQSISVVSNTDVQKACSVRSSRNMMRNCGEIRQRGSESYPVIANDASSILGHAMGNFTPLMPHQKHRLGHTNSVVLWKLPLRFLRVSFTQPQVTVRVYAFTNASEITNRTNANRATGHADKRGLWCMIPHQFTPRKPGPPCC